MARITQPIKVIDLIAMLKNYKPDAVVIMACEVGGYDHNIGGIYGGAESVYLYVGSDIMPEYDDDDEDDEDEDVPDSPSLQDTASPEMLSLDAEVGLDI